MSKLSSPYKLAVLLLLIELLSGCFQQQLLHEKVHIPTYQQIMRRDDMADSFAEKALFLPFKIAIVGSLVQENVDVCNDCATSFSTVRPLHIVKQSRQQIDHWSSSSEVPQRQLAVSLLQHRAAPLSWKEIEWALSDTSPKVRMAAVQSMAHLPAPPHWGLFRKALQDEDEFIRMVALRALPRFRGPQALALLKNLQQDPSPFVRATMAQVLVDFASPQAQALLRALCADPSAYVRERALSAWQQMCQHLQQEASPHAEPLWHPQLGQSRSSSRSRNLPASEQP